MKLSRRYILALLPVLIAQPSLHSASKTPFESQTPSTLKYGTLEDNAPVVEITNVNFELVGSRIPGRPRDENMILRKTTRTRQVIGDMGMEATTTVEAWPLGVDPKQKPVYTVTTSGKEPTAKNDEVLLISRGLEEVEWWSAYKLGTGAHLFDTYVPMLAFESNQTWRYAGLEVPPDDTKDARLKARSVVAVLTYTSGERVIREALITCDDPKRAELLRSFADATRRLAYSGRALHLVINQNEPARPLATINVPIAGDDLDLAHSQLPQGLHIAAWNR